MLESPGMCISWIWELDVKTGSARDMDIFTMTNACPIRLISTHTKGKRNLVYLPALNLDSFLKNKTYTFKIYLVSLLN